MKLIVQIPCYNEESTLPQTLRDLPRQIDGIDCVEWLLIDDGSTDKTVEVAKAGGVDHIVSLSSNRGLAKAFVTGLDAGLRLGADIIVNTDGDNQYQGGDIGKLVEPIVNGQGDLAVGCRSFDEIEDFSWVKKKLQRLGSWTVRLVSGTSVRDAASGFRAFSREAALRMNVYSSYTYTMDTVIQAGLTGLEVVSVPIRTNPKTRKSRLFGSTIAYVSKTALAILRVFLLYRPAKFFFFGGLIPFAAGTALCIRWLVLYFGDLASGEVARGREPSLILAAILIIAAVQIWLFGLLADLSGANRALTEDLRYRIRSLTLGESDSARPPPGE